MEVNVYLKKGLGHSFRVQSFKIALKLWKRKRDVVDPFTIHTAVQRGHEEVDSLTFQPLTSSALLFLKTGSLIVVNQHVCINGRNNSLP